MAASGGAGAQTGSQAAAPASQVGELVVTGTHAPRAGFTAPTPVTVLSVEQLKAAAPGTLADAIMELPEVRASNGPTENSAGSAGGGQAFLNLRSLGPQRTLSLLDGQRFVPTEAAGTVPAAAGAVDVSQFPGALIERVDVVTGGASAAYGSDAVAGVVNFILNKTFTGLAGEVQGGQSRYGDDDELKASLAYGTGFGEGGRGHFIISGEYYRSDGIDAGARPFQTAGWDLISIGGGRSMIAPGVVAANLTSTGAFTNNPANGALRGVGFDNAGLPIPFAYGQYAPIGNSASALGLGGEGTNPGDLFAIAGGLERKVFFSRLSWDLDNHWTVYVQGNLGYVDNTYYTGPNSQVITVRPGNAFLPASLAGLVPAAGAALGSYDMALGAVSVDNKNTTARIVTGFNGRIGGWSIDGYYEHGQLIQDVNDYGDLLSANYVAATNAVLSDGRVVCASSIASPGNGCVPYDPFGGRQPTSAQLAYLIGDSRLRQVNTEDVAALNAHGEPFSDWAGPVSVAGGFEYRREATAQTTDALSQANAFRVGNFKPFAGSDDDEEVYLETVVPLLKDAPLARSLDFNGAVRYTNYSLSGGVTTWKVGLTYQPVPDLRFRATQSHDIRAPSLDQLFNGGSSIVATVLDGANGNVTIRQTSLANPDLRPEAADTTTVGIILQPRFVAGLSLSLDYYDIRIHDAIGALSAQQEVSFCAAGVAADCALLTRVGGELTNVNVVPLNLNDIRTNGVDTELSWRRDLEDFGVHLSGILTLRALATYVDNLTSSGPGIPMENGAGDVSQLNSITGGVPKWRANYQVQYDGGPWTLFVQERFIGAGHYGNPVVVRQDGIINPPNIPAVWYTDLNIRYRLPQYRNVTLYGGVTNLFNRKPPVDPTPLTLPTITNPSLYDTIGQFFRLGVDFKY
jgi:outer membrane receptor protein involved in Fe transport